MITGFDVGMLPRLRLAYPILGPDAEWLSGSLSANAATAALNSDSGRFFLKRYDGRWRTPEDLAAEHALVCGLARVGYPTPAPVPNAQGQTLTMIDGAYHALYPWAPGEDRYHSAPVFAPYLSLGEARSAGRHLGWLHRLAGEIPGLAARPPGGLLASLSLLRAPEVPAALDAMLRRSPGLEPWLRGRPEYFGIVETLRGAHRGLRPVLETLPSGPIHGDFIKRNLLWSGLEVAAVLDFDLWNREAWLFDLVLALLPCGFDWPHLLAGQGEVALAAMRAMLEGYQSERPLSRYEREALPRLLPVARIEFYLGAIAQALVREEPELCERFWAVLTGSLDWFARHPAEDWAP